MLMRSPDRWTKAARRAPPGFITPAQPILASKPPLGPDWLYAVKHDGFRIVARKEGDSAHLWSRNGRDWSVEFSGITAALKAWRLKSFVLDGEACACDESGWPDFNALLGGGKTCASACFFAFDLLELDGADLRSLPFSERYARLARMLASAPEAIHLSEHTADHDGNALFQHACRLGLEGIVAKKRAARPRRGMAARLEAHSAVRLRQSRRDEVDSTLHLLGTAGHADPRLDPRSKLPALAP